MKALIVSKTHMSSMACVGAINMENHKSIRLMNADGFNQPGDTSFEVGEVWEIDYSPRANIHPPHVEDVIVRRASYVSTIDDVVSYVLASGIPIWRGGLESLFDGNLRFTSSGGCYAQPEAPKQSVGFWIADRSLIRNDFNDKIRFAYRPILSSYTGQKAISYVGYQEPLAIIPSGTLLRVSLARPWSLQQNEELKCWLQLSGWYGIEMPEHQTKPDDENDLPF